MPKFEYKGLTCEACGVTFDFLTRNKKQKYCSKSCAGKSNQNSGRFLKGRKSWNAGTNNSGMKGKIHTPETKEKMRLSSSGDKASNWRGGISKDNELARKSAKYKQWRLLVFERDNYSCQICGAMSAVGCRIEIHADHIQQFATHKELRFDVSNGRTLCATCHRSTPTYGNTGNKAELIA